MWAIKIKALEKWGIFNKKCLENNVRLYFYAPNHYVKNKMVYFVVIGYIEGEQKNKDAFFRSLKKDKKLVYLERDKDFFFGTYREQEGGARTEAVRIAYNPRLVFLKPVIMEETGWEEWEVASPERKDIEDLLKITTYMPNTEFKVLYFKQIKLRNLMISSLMPDITDKQRQAIALAVEHGYYGYPRKIKLKKLAQMMKISLSTYQFHLAKAEEKLLPKMAKSLK